MIEVINYNVIITTSDDLGLSDVETYGDSDRTRQGHKRTYMLMGDLDHTICSSGYIKQDYMHQC